MMEREEYEQLGCILADLTRYLALVSDDGLVRLAMCGALMEEQLEQLEPVAREIALEDVIAKLESLQCSCS